MRRQGSCSKCGFACFSTWRSMNPTKPVVCNSCKSNSSKSGVTDTSKQAAVVTETTDHPTNPISCDIKPSTSLLIKENNPDRKVDPSSLFVFGANISDHVRVLDQQEPTSKGKGKVVASGDGQSSVEIEDHFHTGLSLKSPSTPFENDIHDKINENAAKKLVREEIEKLSFWNACSVKKKKKRNKLPQFAPSPMEMFFNQLCHIKKDLEIVNNSVSFPNEKEKYSLYDDMFIYQKFNFIPENEIGLGAMLLPNPSTELSELRLSAEYSKEFVIKPEPLEVAKPDASTKDVNEASCT